jgi:hypothetical protein
MIEVIERGTNIKTIIKDPVFIEADKVCCLIDGELLVDTPLEDILPQLNDKDYCTLQAVDRRVLVVRLSIIDKIKQKGKLTELFVYSHGEAIPLNHSFDEIISVIGCGIREQTLNTGKG